MSASSLPDLLAGQLPAALALHARTLLRTQSLLEQLLPPALIGHVRVMQLDNHQLSLACDSGAVASRLRHDSTALLDRLASQRVPVSRLRVTVDPALAAPHVPPAEKQGLPSTALDSLDQLETGLDAGPLKDALARLVRHHRVP